MARAPILIKLPGTFKDVVAKALQTPPPPKDAEAKKRASKRARKTK